MKDTHPLIARKVKKMMKEKSAEERLIMGLSMFGMAKECVRSSILAKSKKVSPASLKQHIFLRFYGNDLSHKVKKKILRVLTGRCRD